MQYRPQLSAGGVALAIVLGIISGPIIFYAFMGDYTHSTGVSVSHLAAGLVGGILGIAAIWHAARYRQAGLAGAVTGLAAGIGEGVVAIGPWVANTLQHPVCQDGAACPYFTNQQLIQFSLSIGLFAVIISTLAGYSLALLFAVVRQRLA